MCIKKTVSRAHTKTDFKKMSLDNRCEKSGDPYFWEVLNSFISNSSSILKVNCLVSLPY